MKYPTLKDYPQVSLTLVQSAALVALMQASHASTLEAELEERTARTLGALALIFHRRLNTHAVRVHSAVILFLLTMIETPGDAVLWTWTLFNLRRDVDHVISLQDLCFAFPHGFPAREHYANCWDAQKIDGANALDDPNTWVFN